MLLGIDGLEGLALYMENSESIRIVLTDFEMPNLNGLKLCKEIRDF